jgi:hypothetical protein
MSKSNAIEKIANSQGEMSPALAHIRALTGDADTPVTLQFFDDSEAKRGNMAAVVHGCVRDLWPDIERRQRAGAGVYVTVNQTDLKGRKGDNITAGRAVWADDDHQRGAVRADWPITPHLTIETSPGKFHYYWRTHTSELDQLENVVKGIAATHATDANATGRARVLRLAGTMHLKDPAHPFLVRVVSTSEAPAYAWPQVCAAFPPAVGDVTTSPRASRDDATLIQTLQQCDAGMHDAMLSLAARWACKGAGTEMIEAILRGAMGTGDGSPRWQGHFSDVPRIARGAFEKFATALFTNDGESLAPQRISLSDVLRNPPAPQNYVWAGRIPTGVVTLLGAHGGTGKSTLALQLCTHIATGEPFLGLPTQQGRAVFFSAEDSAAVVRQRFAAICAAGVLDPDTTASRFCALDATHAPTLYQERNARDQKADPFTAVFQELRGIVEHERATLLVIDNASDAFDSSEIDRARVREFVRGLASIAVEHSCAVVLLVHVAMRTANATGHTGGTENYSGSTAWHNSARSRLFLSEDKSADSGGNVLVLTHEKNNYGKKECPLLLSFTDAGLLSRYQDPAHVGKTPNAIKLQNEVAITRLTQQCYERGVYISPSDASAAAHAFKLLSPEPGFPQGLRRAECLRLVADLARRGWIAREDYKTKDSKTKERWRVTDLGTSRVLEEDLFGDASVFDDVF